MKTHQINQNHYKKLITALTLCLAACNESAGSTSEHKGQNYARAVKAEIHGSYLSCYALSEADKKQCTDKLATKYIDKQWQQDKEYVQAFQFESEKLGFKQFLNNLSQPCESITEGPKFDEDKKAYLVLCKPDHQYYMQFNYGSREWNLIKDEVK